MYCLYKIQTENKKVRKSFRYGHAQLLSKNETLKTFFLKKDYKQYYLSDENDKFLNQIYTELKKC